MSLTGTETLQVLGQDATGKPAASTQTVTTQQIANLAGTTGVSQIVLDGATSGSTTVVPQAVASGTLTLPAATDTLVGRATTDNLTNKTVNKVTITAPATSPTLTIADGKTLTANNSLTLAGTDATTMTFPSFSGTVGLAKGARSTAQLDKTSDTTLAPIVGMAVALNAGGTYDIKVRIPVTSNASGGAKVALDTSDTLTLTSSNITAKLFTASGVAVAGTTSGLNTGLGSTAAVTFVEIAATLVVNASGTLIVTAAQNASFGTASSFLVNGSIIAAKIA